MKIVRAKDTSAKAEHASAPAVKRTVRSKSASKTRTTAKAETGPVVNSEQRYEMIATAAYFRAERRGFADGSELQDWLEAEAEIDRMIAEPSETGGETGSKRAFQEKLEAQLKEWDDKLDDLMEKARKAKTEVRHEFEEQLEALRAKRAATHEKLQELRQRTENAWEDLKEGAERAWDDMRTATDNIASRFR